EDGTAGLAAFRSTRPNFVVLDLRIPHVHGKEVCQEIRKQSPDVPMIVLTGSSDEVDRVLLLELGADDYVTKPFSPRELLARVRPILRRSRRGAVSEQFSFDDVTIDFKKMEAARGDRPVPLTPQEFKVLKYFSQNTERVISRDELLNEVWG